MTNCLRVTGKSSDQWRCSVDRGSLGHSYAKQQAQSLFSQMATTNGSWRLSLPACRLRGCQVGQVEDSGLGDCHEVAPLLPQSLICPACTGLRAKAGDYLHCTSTPTTHATPHHAEPHLLPPRCLVLHLQDVGPGTRTNFTHRTATFCFWLLIWSFCVRIQLAVSLSQTNTPTLWSPAYRAASMAWCFLLNERMFAKGERKCLIVCFF